MSDGHGDETVGAVEVALLLEAGDWGDETVWRRLAERAVAAAVEVADLDAPSGAELSLVLTDDAAIRVLNRDHRGKDKPTNVLSFPGFDVDEAPGPLLGDIVIAWETVAREATEEGKSVADHFSHLVVHGMLHLFGYDHEAADDAEAMEAEERRVLARLGIADPYRDTEPEVPSGPGNT
jgi:probable rRNA maturation factor